MFRILIISYADWDSLMELPAVFKEAGCNVDIYCKKGSWILNNSFYDEWIDGGTDEAAFLGKLLDFIERKWDYYQWIIPGDDIILRLLNDTITSERLFYKLLPMCKMENRELLGSKAGFSSLCAKYDIATPRFMIYDGTQTPEAIGSYMGYPFMLKTDRSEAGTGVFKCDNQQDLEQTLAGIQHKENIVFQQFIQGYDINMEVLFWKGEPLVYSYAKLLKILGKFGLSTQRMFSQHPAIAPELQKIGRSIGINGFASIAFMYSETENKHYLIEIDVRPNSWIYYGKFTGNNFAEGVKKIVRNDLTLLQWDKTKYPAEIKIALYKKDMMRAIVEKDLGGIMAWVNNKDNCRRYKPTYDKKLLSSCNKFLWWFFRELVKEKVQRIAGKN